MWLGSVYQRTVYQKAKNFILNFRYPCSQPSLPLSPRTWVLCPSFRPPPLVDTFISVLDCPTKLYSFSLFLLY